MEENIGTLLSNVARLMRRAFDERVRAIGVTRPQWQVLGTISTKEGINQGALAEILEVEPITAGRMIDRLEEGGLVERRADPADRRAWRLHLTERGQELLEELYPYGMETLKVALDGIDDAQRAQLMAMLEQIRSNLSRR